MPPLSCPSPLIGRRICIAVIAGCFAASALLPSSALAQPARASPRSDEQQVAAVDDEYVVAEVQRDEATLRRLVDDKFLFNHPDGTTTGKEAFVQSVLKLPLVGESVRERSIIVEGDMALVFATADLRLTNPDKPEPSLVSLRYTCAYVRRGGQWRMLALQMQPRSAK